MEEFRKPVTKERLDIRLVELGLVESRNLAQRLVMAGSVRVDGQMVLKPSQMILPESVVELVEKQKFVSRGGEKLDAALVAFGLEDLNGLPCADIGASTGGFTDCLLQHGATSVISVDSGHGDFHWKLRTDPRVTLLEHTNARNLVTLPGPVKLVCVDVSFISLRILFPVIKGWLQSDGGQLVTLIKPQFEAGREEADKGKGVIRDPAIHTRILKDVLSAAQEEGFRVNGLILSPLEGPKGNREFLAHYTYPGTSRNDIYTLIKEAMTSISTE
ncbi:MAG: TlyA family RNA methyltransferase [Chloroflexi bacterium]|nr:TlyA family RNA methyltransferase [Chloroflexota bacterium]